MAKPRDMRNDVGAPSPAPAPQPETAAPPPQVQTEVAEVSSPVEQESVPSSRDRVRAAAPVGGDTFHVLFLPTVLAVLMVLCLLPQGIPLWIVDTLSNYVPLPGIHGPLGSAIAPHIVMLLLALGAIYALRRRLPQIDFGLVLPKGRSYIATAIILGLFAGIVMALVDNASSLISHSVPRGYDTGYGVGVSSMPGWLLYYGLLVGPTEEVPFRGLVLTYLMMSMPGRVRFRGFEMKGAGVVLAAIFTIGFGFYALISNYLLVAIGQMLYVFFGTLALAYWFEKSRSLLAPVVGHSVASVTWQALTFAIVIAFR
jgi:hypothetical protein